MVIQQSRPDLRGWKLLCAAAIFFIPFASRPDLRGWKLSSKSVLTVAGKVPTRLEGMETSMARGIKSVKAGPDPT